MKPAPIRPRLSDESAEDFARYLAAAVEAQIAASHVSKATSRSAKPCDLTFPTTTRTGR